MYIGIGIVLTQIGARLAAFVAPGPAGPGGASGSPFTSGFSSGFKGR